MQVENYGIIDADVYIQNREINPDALHYYRYDLIHTDQQDLAYDVTKAIQEWGVLFWFSLTPAGKPLGRNIYVTHQTDISFRVNGDMLDIVKGGAVIETLFQIYPTLTYYINLHNQQNNDNFYHLRIGEYNVDATDLCA